MLRCFSLAKLGIGNVAPNPMVGAVLVYDGRIIGEGYHRQYGGTHAEINCINSVNETDKHLISKSILYVSLEPCVHHGKTPPCTDRIISEKVPHVVIGCRDSFEEVNGKGIEKLKAAGIKVTSGILEQEALELNKRFFTFFQKKRPYIILKWAQSHDKKIAGENFKRISISNDYTNRLVHKWRSEEASIIIGTNTALYDNPSLTTRFWQGRNPVRLIVDMELRLPGSLQVFDGVVKTIVFNKLKNEESSRVCYVKIQEDHFVRNLKEALFHMNIQSVIVEGGSQFLQSFIDAGCWDEARVIENSRIIIGKGVEAPVLKEGYFISQEKIETDFISYYKNVMQA